MFTPTCLKINCGFARTAMFELEGSTQRSKEYQSLFPNFQHRDNYFQVRTSGFSNFDDNCNTINKFFKKWEKTSRNSYLAFFSSANWRLLPETCRKKHTESYCDECSHTHNNYQHAFPGKPVHKPSPKIVTIQGNLAGTTEKEECQSVLRELNEQWEKKYDHSLSSVIPNLAPKENLVLKETKSERKNRSRTMKRQLVQEITKKIGESTTITILAEGESMGSYSRKRMAMSFERPRTAVKRHTSHSPHDQSHQWSHENALEYLQTFPDTETINWSMAARLLNIPGSNKGQVLKEFAVKQQIDITKLEKKEASLTPRVRCAKKTLRGREISVPCLPTPKTVKAQKQALLDSGQLTIGEPCTPYKLIKSVVTYDGDVETITSELVGRKIPLTQVRKSLLDKHTKYMRLNTDSELEGMNREQILQLLSIAHHSTPNSWSTAQLQAEIMSIQRTRNLAIWHDHSTILKTGYILFAVWVVYDPAVFFTDKECGIGSNIQETVEQPTIYMLAPSSSSPSDQLALIPDRVECLQELTNPLKSSNGITVLDRMRFFCGDKPAQQFERGTQIGGTYKCGGCGCKDSMMQDLAYSIQCKWRSLFDLQQLVLGGKFGCCSNKLKPFENLKVADLGRSLR